METKKIKNFLYYNWLKIAALLFAVIFCAVTFMQCSQRAETDLGIMYVGKAVVSDKLPALSQALKTEGIIKDADGDGEITLNSKAIVLPASKDKMIEQQVPEQIQVEIISGENLLYILESSTLISYAVDESFADITDLAEKYNISKDECLCYENGAVYAIPIEGSLFLENMGIKSEGMYLALRNYLEKDAKKTLNINAKTALDYILERSK